MKERSRTDSASLPEEEDRTAGGRRAEMLISLCSPTWTDIVW